MEITTLTVFTEGLLSFFSPCVLPLLPVYVGYLSGGTLEKDEEGKAHYDRRKVLINTLFFVIGISAAFFVLGMGISTIGQFFAGNKTLLARIGGVLIILLGIYQTGVIGQSGLLSRELKLPIDIGKMRMSPVTAFIMGFVMSFAWSPCVGPVLSSVLIMAAAASTSTSGFALIGVYTLGYVIPFILLGVFTTSAMDFFGRHRDVVKYTVKIGGVLLIIMGVLMLSGKMNTLTGYLAKISGSTQTVDASGGASDEMTGDADSAMAEEAAGNQTGDVNSGAAGEANSGAAGEANGSAAGEANGSAAGEANGSAAGDASDNVSEGTQNTSGDGTAGVASADAGDKAGAGSGNTADAGDKAGAGSGNTAAAGDKAGAASADSENASDSTAEENEEMPMAPDFTLVDQHGTTHSLADYRGKIVFLNIWGSWCPYCVQEMPDIQALHEEYSAMDDPDVVFVGVCFPGYNGETDAEGVKEFLEENGYTYTNLMDESGGDFLSKYPITGYPTTFMIGPEGELVGYVPGAMSEDKMEYAIEQTRELLKE